MIIADETDSEDKHSALPAPLELSQMVASVDVSGTEVEHGDTSDSNHGSDPYLCTIGWIRP